MIYQIKAIVKRLLEINNALLEEGTSINSSNGTAESGVKPHSIEQSILQWYIPVKSMVVIPPPPTPGSLITSVRTL